MLNSLFIKFPKVRENDKKRLLVVDEKYFFCGFEDNNLRLKKDLIRLYESMDWLPVLIGYNCDFQDMRLAMHLFNFEYCFFCPDDSGMSCHHINTIPDDFGVKNHQMIFGNFSCDLKIKQMCNSCNFTREKGGIMPLIDYLHCFTQCIYVGDRVGLDGKIYYTLTQDWLSENL